MAYSVEYTNRFKKDLKRCAKRNMDITAIRKAITTLADTGNLPPKYHPHKLVGNHSDEWECHIAPDWLMVWKQNDNLLKLLFLQTGTHSDIFKNK